MIRKKDVIKLRKIKDNMHQHAIKHHLQQFIVEICIFVILMGLEYFPVIDFWNCQNDNLTMNWQWKQWTKNDNEKNENCLSQ